MYKIRFITIFLFILSANAQVNFQLKISGFSNYNGSLLVAIHSNESTFLSEEITAKPFQTFKKKIISDTVKILTELPEGNYAISVYHDENLDSKLNTNFLGAPSEDYGFSNNARRIFSAPSFQEALFKIDSLNTFHSIQIK